MIWKNRVGSATPSTLAARRDACNNFTPCHLHEIEDTRLF